MLEKTGIATSDQVQKVFPPERFQTKPKAIIECYQEIPCNPCETSCPYGAITVGEDINQIPKLDVEKCVGCAICVAQCPGLAIMVASKKRETAQFRIPWEYLPLPQKGEIWSACDRSGARIGTAMVKHVIPNQTTSKTAVVTVDVDASLYEQFSTIGVRL